MELKGRNRGLHPWSEIPEDIQPGDYWQVADGDDENVGDVIDDEPTNLTGGNWWVAAPTSKSKEGYALGNLRKHTVRENEDGTISVLPGDGSSNSILISGPHGEEFHGYIYNGVWKSV